MTRDQGMSLFTSAATRARFPRNRALLFKAVSLAFVAVFVSLGLARALSHFATGHLDIASGQGQP